MSEETAFALYPHEALACAIAFREMEGEGRMDWDSGEWVTES